jgi:hypothetical protein
MFYFWVQLIGLHELDSLPCLLLGSLDDVVMLLCSYLADWFSLASRCLHWRTGNVIYLLPFLTTKYPDLQLEPTCFGIALNYLAVLCISFTLQMGVPSAQ